MAAVFPGDAFRELALVVALERDAVCIHLLQVARDFGRVDTGIEIGQIPFRQLAGFRRGSSGLAGGGLLAGRGFAGRLAGTGCRGF